MPRFRPQRPKRLRPEVWELIRACWQHDPVARPSMAAVAQRLDSIMATMHQQQQSMRPHGHDAQALDARAAASQGCACTIC
jgi:hypothetical protein